MTDGPGPGNSSQSPRSSRSPSRRPVDPSIEQTDTQRTEGSRENESSGQDGHRAFRDKLSSFVSEYRDQKLSKSQVISRISTLIDDSAIFSDSEKENAIDLYIEEINSIDSNRDPRFFVPGQEKSKAVDQSVHEILDQVADRIRSRDEFQDDDVDDLDEPPRRKRRAKESNMGWYNPDDSPSSPESDSCRKTCKRLRIYNEDIPGSKFLARLNRNAPASIPSNQWERILRGEALDLDHFLSSLHQTSINEEGETCIGNAKISVGISDAKRRVSTASEWSSAWHLASRAVAFAFPHRLEELRDYGDFIEAEFAGKITSSHPRIILFNVAIRNIVQGGQSSLLTDRSIHLYGSD